MEHIRDKKKSLIALSYRYLVSEGALVGPVNSIQLKEEAFRDLFVEFERQNFAEKYDEIYAEHEDMTFFALVHKAEIMEDGEDA